MDTSKRYFCELIGTAVLGLGIDILCSPFVQAAGLISTTRQEPYVEPLTPEPSEESLELIMQV